MSYVIEGYVLVNWIYQEDIYYYSHWNYTTPFINPFWPWFDTGIMDKNTCIKKSRFQLGEV